MDKAYFKIVIPNYNNIAYISKCLDSILNQTFQDFKIIIVDDMSTDMSDKVCEMYSRLHSDKIVFIRNTTKKYPGGCRNIAIDYQLDAEYYFAIDGDDTLYDNTSLQKLYEYSQRTHDDVIVFNWIFEHLNGYQKNSPSFKCTLEYAFTHLANCPWCGAPLKIIKNSIIEKQLEHCAFGEDTWQWLMIMDKNPSISKCEDTIYVYHVNPVSTTQTALRKHEGIHLKTKEIFYTKIQKYLQHAKTQNVIDSIQYRINRKGRWN